MRPSGCSDKDFGIVRCCFSFVPFDCSRYLCRIRVHMLQRYRQRARALRDGKNKRNRFCMLRDPGRILLYALIGP